MTPHSHDIFQCIPAKQIWKSVGDWETHWSAGKTITKRRRRREEEGECIKVGGALGSRRKSSVRHTEMCYVITSEKVTIRQWEARTTRETFGRFLNFHLSTYKIMCWLVMTVGCSFFLNIKLSGVWECSHRIHINMLVFSLLNDNG